MQQTILDSLTIPDAPLLGEGVEAWVYEFDKTRVVRIYKAADQELRQRLEIMRSFYGSLDSRGLEVIIPKILSIHEQAGIVYTIDRKLPGRPLADELAATHQAATVEQLLHQYMMLVDHVGMLHKPYDYFGEVLQLNPLRTKTWPEFIIQKTASAYEHAPPSLNQAVGDMPALLRFIKNEVAIVSDVTKPLLIHGDYHGFNILVDATHKQWALNDFGGLTLAGDPRMDLASSIVGFMEEEDGMRRSDGEFIYSHLIATHGPKLTRILHLYRLYYAVLFASTCKTTDSRAYKWSVRSLQEHLAGTYTY